MMTGGSSGSIATKPRFGLIVSITLSGIMANTLITPVIPDIRDAFHVGTSATGLLLASATAPGIVLAPLFGLLADRYGRREVVVPCLVIFGISGGLAAFAPSFAVLLVCRFMQGIGSAGLINLAVTIIGDHWDGAERTHYIGRNAAALTASIVVLPPIGGLLAALGGWRLSFAPNTLALFVAAMIWSQLPRTVRVQTTFRGQLREAAPYARTPLVITTVAFAFVLFVMIFGLVLTVMPIYLADRFDVHAAGRGLMLAVPAFASTAGALTVGRLRHRIGIGRTLSLAFMFLTFGFVLIASVPALPAIVIALLLYGAGEGLSIPTLQDTVASAAPMQSRGALVALFVGFARAGQTAGPVACGLGLAHLGARTTFALAAGVTAVSTVIARPDRASVP